MIISVIIMLFFFFWKTKVLILDIRYFSAEKREKRKSMILHVSQEKSTGRVHNHEILSV